MTKARATRGRSHDTTVDDTIQFAPTYTTGGATQQSIPLFVNADTGEPEDYDPAELKATGRVRSPVLCVLGEIGHGKTATSIAVAARYRLRRAGKGGKRRMSMSIYDIRRNNARPEYKKLCDYLGIKQVPLSDFRLNMLAADLGMKPHELLLMVARSLQLELHRKLSTHEMKSLRHALKLLLEYFKDEADMAALMACLRRLKESVILRYESEIEQGAGGKHAERLAKMDRALGYKAKLSSGLLKAAYELADTLENLLDGVYGEMFGGDHSLASIMKANKGLVVFDFSELTEEALTQVMAMMWQVKTSAMRRGDHDLYYDIEVHDENHKFWRNLEYARAMYTFLKQIRSTSTFVILNTHRLRDYESVGAVGSEQYQLATNMIEDIDMWLLGRHTPTAAKDTQKHLDLTDEETERLPELERGVWGLKIGREPIRWVAVDLTEVEEDLTFSDDANLELTSAGMEEQFERAIQEEILMAEKNVLVST